MRLISTNLLYDLLTNKFGKEAAEGLTSYIDLKIDSGIEIKEARLATRQDISDVRKEIADVKINLTREIADVKINLTREIANIKMDLTKEIANVKTEVIKWMFIFWIGQVAVTFGFILLFLKR